MGIVTVSDYERYDCIYHFLRSQRWSRSDLNYIRIMGKYTDGRESGVRPWSVRWISMGFLLHIHNLSFSTQVIQVSVESEALTT